MKGRRGFSLRLIGLAALASMTLVGASGVAQAAAHHHHHHHGAKGGGGAGTSGPPMLVTVSPYSLVETGQSEVWAVIQVETSPTLAGDQVAITSSQLVASCLGTVKIFNAEGTNFVLDDDGNVTVVVEGTDCAPGTSIVEADLEEAPYYTALTSIMATPPVVTTPGVVPFPDHEVETGDSAASGYSNVYAVFYVETNPVYAEQTVSIASPELEERCGAGWTWIPGNGGPVVTGPTPTDPTTTLDDDGNAQFTFMGSSCAAGVSSVIADIDAGTHQTYVTTYTILAPQPNAI